MQETLIVPRKGWQALDFREMAAHRDLLYFLVWRDIKVRYKQTVLGATWAILNTVLTMLILWVVFGILAKLPSDGAPYPLFVLAAILPWNFFQHSVSQSGISLVSQSQLLTKVYFPRIFVPAAAVGAMLVDLLLSFGVYGCMLIAYQHLPGISVLLLPVLVLLTILAALGTGCLLASLTVTYRDFRFVIPFLVQLWMWATPVAYSVSLIPEKWRWAVAINPMAGIVGGFRSVLLNQPLDWTSLGISSLITVALFLFGVMNFKRTERRFADIV